MFFYFWCIFSQVQRLSLHDRAARISLLIDGKSRLRLIVLQEVQLVLVQGATSLTRN